MFMEVYTVIGVLLAAYLLGAVPYGFIITKLFSGKDVTQYESGRTGTTNTMRVAGWKAAIVTGILDVLKGSAAVWIAHHFMPHSLWLQVLAPIAAIIGHNYSIFMIIRGEDGKIHLRGGAGGAPSVGGAIGLWWPIIYYILPVGIVLWLGVGYASLATISVGIVAIIVFAYRAIFEQATWVYVIYGVLVEIVVLWSLRPNIKRLLNGTERVVGLRARLINKA